MAKLFLDKDESFTALNGNLTIFGSTGYETVTVAGLGVKVDQNVEQINFDSMAYKLKFLQAGNTLKVFDSLGTTLIATIPVQQDGTTLNFAGEELNLTLSNTAVMKIGEVTIPSDNAVAISVEPVTPPDTTAPNAPVVNLYNDAGTSQTDKITNDLRLLVQAEQNAKVEYSVDGGANWYFASYYGYGVPVPVNTLPNQPSQPINGSPSTDEQPNQPVNGQPQQPVVIPTPANFMIDNLSLFKPGLNTVKVRQTDAAGNLSDVTTFEFAADRKRPDFSNVQMQFKNSDGSSLQPIGNYPGYITNDPNVTLSVTGVEAGAKIYYYYSVDDGWENLVYGQYEAPPKFKEGDNMVSLSLMDVAGNFSSGGIGQSLVLDTTKPANPVISLANDTGDSSTDKITTDAHLKIENFESGATAVKYSLDSTDGIDGSWITISTNSFLLQPPPSVVGPATPAIDNGVFQINAAVGANQVYVKQVDKAGNESDATKFEFVYEQFVKAPVETKTVSSAVTIDVSTKATLLNFAAGNYNATVTGFSSDDIMKFPNATTVKNSNFSDGHVEIQWAGIGQVISVTLTGLTSTQDGLIFSANSFDSVFGAGSIAISTTTMIL